MEKQTVSPRISWITTENQAVISLTAVDRLLVFTNMRGGLCLFMNFRCKDCRRKFDIFMSYSDYGTKPVVCKHCQSQKRPAFDQ